jgi:short-subunit dehydrogenase
MGIDRKAIPSWLWMTAGRVVDASLLGFESDKLIVVPGLRYRLIVALAQLTPWPLRRYLGSRAGLKFRHVTK